MSKYQNQTLMISFQANPFLKNEEKHRLAKLLNLKERRIGGWFTHMRRKRRAEGLLPKSNVQ